MNLTMRLFLKKEHKEMIKADPILAERIPDTFANDLDPFDPVVERLIEVIRDSEECLGNGKLMLEFSRKELAAVSHFEISWAKELKTTTRDDSVNERELLDDRLIMRKGGVEPIRIMKPYRLLRPKVSPEGIYELRPGREVLVGSMVKETFAEAGLLGYTLEPVLELNSGLPHGHCWQLWSETYIGPVVRDETDYRTNPSPRSAFENFGVLTFEPEILAQMADFGRTSEPLPYGSSGYPEWIISRRVAECHRKAKLGRWGLKPVLASGSVLHRAYLDLWRAALERVAPLVQIGGGYKRTWYFENDPEVGRELIDHVRAVYDKAPDQIELLPELEPNWRDPDRVRAFIDSLHRHGFEEIGTFRIREYPHFIRTALYHPDHGWQALVCESLATAYAEIAIKFYGDNWLEVSNSPYEGNMPPRPGVKRINHRAYTIEDLLELAQREPAMGPVCPINAANFAEYYKESYTNSASWGREYVNASRENAFRVGKGIVNMRTKLEETRSAPAPETPPEQEKERQGSSDYFLNVFTKAGLAEKWPDFAAKARPEILLELESTSEKNLPIGCSKIGGRPDLTQEVAWPRDANRNPLSFLAQINFAEISSLNDSGLLPATGVASFFYDAQGQPWGYEPGDVDKGLVLFLDEPLSKLKRAPFPKKLTKEGRFESCRLSFEPSLSLPDVEGDEVKGLLSAEQLEAYREINQFAQRTKLLGWPDTLQGDMALQCELVSNGLSCGDGQAYSSPQAEAAAGNPAGWRLLLQLDSESEAGMTWGDEGRLYFWIREGDLKQRRFEKCRVILQCT